MDGKQRIRVTFLDRTRRMQDKFYDNVDYLVNKKLNDILKEVRDKGQIIEVWVVDGEDNPVTPVRWKHLY